MALSDRIGLMHEGVLIEVGCAGGALFAAGASGDRGFSRQREFCPGASRTERTTSRGTKCWSRRR